ncbi:hypothetical protein [Mannheimia haemolytica]|uniref:hypothetical protein n=1 Tax=Mannheimia haemolytica TaxID=75985 RepID=UPI001F0119CD|nr:hypothetical protein [Mannheimia haemolytica]
MSNVIYRGSVKREPQTVNIVINDTSAPGAVVKLHNGKLEAAADLKGRRFYWATTALRGRQSNKRMRRAILQRRFV